MKKFVYCEGVDEAWMKDSDDSEYADEKTPYFESGPFYLASDVDAYRQAVVEDAKATDARIAELEKAIADHNASCESACGVGNNEGINCGYRPYLPRRCTHCPRDWLIELMVSEGS